MFMTPKFDAARDESHDGAKGTAPGATTSVSSLRSQSAPAAARKGARRGASLLVVVALLASIATGFLGGYMGAAGYRNSGTLSSADISRQRELANNESQLIATIAKSVGPSVVSVNVTSQTDASSDFFGFTVPSREQSAAGTGIIISSEGVIVTNRHVVPAGATDVNITLSDGTQLDDVSVLGRTTDGDNLDIAFLKIN
ncbi:MAG: putative HtrA2 peptidase, partial [Candidatus Saccharibacteria bacterium]|nr:putative HtrA2 peptidase [Candidatus Saccharibacteria bacterium]